jgi:hypothetical protein
MLLKPCPCCGGEAHFTEGNQDIKQIEAATCLRCFLTIEGTDAGDIWNTRYVPAGYQLMPDLLTAEMMVGMTLSERELLQDLYGKLIAQAPEVIE